MTEPERFFQRALEGAAELVALYGDEFLPAFTRMEDELKAITQASSASARARAMAIAQGTTIPQNIAVATSAACLHVKLKGA